VSLDIRAAGGQAIFVTHDVTDETVWLKVISRVLESYGRLDVLVNNAGISHASKPGTPFEQIIKSNSLATAPLDDVRKVWETNVFGVIAVTQAMLPLLREAPAARIVNVGSDGGSLTLNSNPDNPHRAMFGNYSASKSAAHAVTFAFAMALEPISTTSTARAAWRKARVNPCASRSSVRTARRARSRTRMARCRGDAVVPTSKRPLRRATTCTIREIRGAQKEVAHSTRSDS
jgi:NAD(P)-dependent dehydrogenase (short-subunit alcohol dehydrogenase family)